jgi:hypothetical protein
LEENDERITTAAVCVYPSRVEDARNALARMDMAERIPVASGICQYIGTEICAFTASLHVCCYLTGMKQAGISHSV